MSKSNQGTERGVGRPKGPLKRSRVIRLRRDLDEALDVYSRIYKTPVSTIIERLVNVWADANQIVIERGRELFRASAGGRESGRRRPRTP
jgi:hypothetical protein